MIDCHDPNNCFVTISFAGDLAHHHHKKKGA